MTTDLAAKGLWLAYVGTDFKLYVNSDADGNLANTKSVAWGTKNNIRGEPFTLHIWENVVQIYHIDNQSGHLMAKAAKITSPGGATDGWYDLGGILAGSPVACRYDEKGINVFAVGMNGQLYSCGYNATNSSNAKWQWSKLATSDFQNPLAFEPERIYCSSNGQRRMDLVAVSVTNDLYHRFFNGSAWSQWTAVGRHVVGSRPFCWTPNADRVDIVCKDARDQKLYHTASEKGVWLGWQKIGDTQVIYDPAGTYCTESDSRYHLGAASAVKGSYIYSILSFQAGKLGTWSAYEDIGGIFSSSPKLAHRKGIIDVFGRGMDSALYIKTNANSKWGNFVKIEGKAQTKVF